MRGFVRKSSLLVISFLFLAYLAIFLSIEARGGYQLGSKLADPSYAYQLTFDQTKKLLAQLPISGKTLIERGKHGMAEEVAAQLRVGVAGVFDPA